MGVGLGVGLGAGDGVGALLPRSGVYPPRYCFSGSFAIRTVYVETMGRGNNLDQLRLLDDSILAEVIREGEARLLAQFTAASAADQRGAAWSGFVITLTLASVSATATLGLDGKNLALAVITGLLSGLLAIAALVAVRTIRPLPFHLPGNCPENWLPKEWESGRPYDMKQARIEQARCLNNQIDDNAVWAEGVAKDMALSMGLTATSVLLAAIYVCGFICFRLFG